MAKRAAKPRGEKKEELSFEEALTRLEAVVDQLENGDLQLETSLGVFEEGVALSRQCAVQLEAAKERIEVLTREGGDWKSQPLDAPEFADEETDSSEGAGE